MPDTAALGTSDSVLGLSQILGAPDQGTLTEAPVQNLALSQQVSNVLIGPVRVSNFSVQVLWNAGSFVASPSNELNLSDELLDFLVVGDRKIVDQTINFSQAADFGEKRGDNTLNLVQTASFIGPREHSARNNLGLQQGVRVCFGAPWTAVAVSHSLGLTDAAGTAAPLSINQSLSLTQSAARLSTLADVLDLSQTVNVGVSNALAQDLGISQSIVSEAIVNRSLGHSGIIKQSFTYFIDSPCNRKRYTRFDGEGDEGLPAKRLAFDAQFTLESGSGSLVQLRNPETDDRHRIGFTRVNRETRGGELNVFADPAWPKVDTLLFTITNLKKTQAESLHTFFQDTLGQQVKLYDWTGTVWLGVVTTPNEAITEDHPDRWTALFEFEGVAFDGQAPDNHLSLSQTAEVLAVFTRTSAQALDLQDSADFIGPKYIDVNDSLNLSQSEPSEQSQVFMEELFGGVGTSINGTIPDTGSNQWTAHSNYRDDGTMSGGVEAGAYYPFVPKQGTKYSIFFEVRNLVTADGEDALFFLAKGAPNPSGLTGNIADGTTGFTTLRAGHALKSTSGTADHAFRRGNTFSGLADTQLWSDVFLRQTAPDIDLKIVLDTRGGAGNWTVQFFAKNPANSVYTAVSPVLGMLSEDVGAVAYANNSPHSSFTMNQMSVVENKPL